MFIRLVILFLLTLPLRAQLFLANAADGSLANFAPGSLVLVADIAVQDPTTATFTISPSITVPVSTKISNGIGLARLPANLPLGPASATLTINGVTTEPVSFNVVSTGFAIFTGPISAGLLGGVLNGGAQTGASFFVFNPGLHFAYRNNGPFAGLAQPAHPGDYLTIYGTGLGNATPDQVVVTIAGLPVTVTYAGPAPEQPGVDQINVHVPPGLPLPDSCSDAFTVTIAGTPIAPKGIAYTQSATSCPSQTGFNVTELAAIDGGTQVPYVNLSLISSIAPGAQTGFTRSDSTLSVQLNSSEAIVPLTFADSVLYSCQMPEPGYLNGILAAPYSGLTLTMGKSFIPIGQPLASSMAPTPDDLPPSLFQPGIWQLVAPNFSQPLQLPPTIQLQNFAGLQSIDSARDLTVTWNSSGYSKSDVLSLSMATRSSSPFFIANSITCYVPAAAGSLVIPAALLQSIPKSVNLSTSVYSSQTPNFRLPQADGSTIPLQVTYNYSETFPVTLH